MPEKCLTFCSQRAEGMPLCRMLCLRRRQVPLSREEEVAKLRPRKAFRSSPSSTALSQNSESDAASTSSEAESSLASRWAFNPFESLRKALDPYSIVYVRGTPDGVVGRYMEELEGDDGYNDFGEGISRHSKPRGRPERVVEYLDWGETGSVLHVPLTSLFHPVLAVPSTVSFLLSPGINFLNLYRSSFSDGSQTRTFRMFRDAFANGDGLTFLSTLWTFAEKKGGEVQALEAEQKAKNDLKLDKERSANWRTELARGTNPAEYKQKIMDMARQHGWARGQGQWDDMTLDQKRTIYDRYLTQIVMDHAREQKWVEKDTRFEQLSILEKKDIYARWKKDAARSGTADASSPSPFPMTKSSKSPTHDSRAVAGKKDEQEQPPRREERADAQQPGQGQNASNTKEAGRVAVEIERLRSGSGGSGLRRKIEEAMERDEEFRRSKARAAAGGSGEGNGDGDHAQS